MLIDDDEGRSRKLRLWLPENTTLVETRSAGSAIGLLRRTVRGEYAGILLDYDLQKREMTAADSSLSGGNLVDIIIQRIEREVAILVHSQNPLGSLSMAERLDRAGYWVSRVPIDMLTRERFSEWVHEVRLDWLDRYPDW